MFRESKKARIGRLGEDNIIYFCIGQRVLCCGKPGIVKGLHIKPYDYPVGYDVVCDDGSYASNMARGAIQSLQ